MGAVQVGGASDMGAHHTGMLEAELPGFALAVAPAGAACGRWGPPLAIARVLYTQVGHRPRTCHLRLETSLQSVTLV